MMAHSAPTFLVSVEEQRELLEQFQRRCLHFSEQFQPRNRPLCFSAVAHQQPHPAKIAGGSEDGDATLASPMILGVCDGVTQVEELGVNAAQLPRELLRSCENLARAQLLRANMGAGQSKESYLGPIELLREAYATTESYGATSVLLAVMDNSTQIHGKLHPMVGIVTLGDCELVMLRRSNGRKGPLQAVLHTEMQRIGGHGQRPLQLARLDQDGDNSSEDDALDAIERGSGLHCTSAHPGDLLVLGSDGLFDNLFLNEVIDICNLHLPPPHAGSDHFVPAGETVLQEIAAQMVRLAHQKSELRHGRPWRRTPVGLGGKADDTSVVVAEVVPWTMARRRAWERTIPRTQPSCDSLFGCSRGRATCTSDHEIVVSDTEAEESSLLLLQHVEPDGCCVL